VAKIIADGRIAAVTLTAARRRPGRRAAAGDALKKSVLELGGSDPFLVAVVGRPRAAVPMAAQARCINNGQSCIASKRFIVVDELADEFLERFSQAMADLVVGDPFDPATDVGPLVSDASARRSPARSTTPRPRARWWHRRDDPDGPGFFYRRRCSRASRRHAGRQRGGLRPVAVVERVADIDEAIAVAN